MPILKFKKPAFLKNFHLQKATYYTTWGVVNLIVLGFLFTAIMGTFFYVYKNIYNLYSHASTIIILNSELTIDFPDFKGYDKIQKAIIKKNTPLNIPKKLRNIFEYGDLKNTTSTQKNNDDE